MISVLYLVFRICKLVFVKTAQQITFFLDDGFQPIKCNGLKASAPTMLFSENLRLNKANATKKNEFSMICLAGFWPALFDGLEARRSD